jgi:hypothetical protein
MIILVPTAIVVTAAAPWLTTRRIFSTDLSPVPEINWSHRNVNDPDLVTVKTAVNYLVTILVTGETSTIAALALRPLLITKS